MMNLEKARRLVKESVERKKKENRVLRVVYELIEKESEYALCREARENKLGDIR